MIVVTVITQMNFTTAEDFEKHQDDLKIKSPMFYNEILESKQKGVPVIYTTERPIFASTTVSTVSYAEIK